MPVAIDLNQGRQTIFRSVRSCPRPPSPVRYYSRSHRCPRRFDAARPRLQASAGSAGVGVCADRSRLGWNWGLLDRQHRAIGTRDRDRPPAGSRLDLRGCRLDAVVARSRYCQAGSRSGLRTGMRSGRATVSRSDRRRDEPGAWYRCRSLRPYNGFAGSSDRRTSADIAQPCVRDSCPARSISRPR
jgi:hypothetical protein